MSKTIRPENDARGLTDNPALAAFNQQLCQFLDNSPTPFHATSQLSQLLEAEGFTGLSESDVWDLQPGGRYYVTRNGSSIIAWVQGQRDLAEQGLRMLGAHTDSPCLKAKPQADLYEHNSWRLGVEVYGGALLNPWFDRDLSLAGRVHYLSDNDTVKEALIDCRCPIGTIPSLAIHLDREANSKRSVNAQTQLPVLLASGGKSEHDSLEALLFSQLAATGHQAERILDHELFFYDTQPAAVIGFKGDFIASARLDNLLSCFVGAKSLIASAEEASANGSLLICSDHEEVGSGSAAGAAGPFLPQVLQRLLPDPEAFARAMHQSVLISTDNAHALHPSHADKMDSNHSPKINAGPVIKVNANQRYASNSETQALFRRLCGLCEIPVQNFVMRSDMACGSTIGPITATSLGIKTLDVGLPTYGMHSIRELAGSRDALALHDVLIQFLRRA